MKRLVMVGWLVACACLVGCDDSPTRRILLKKEAECLQCYCFSNAPVARAALLDCARYAEQCQAAGVEGIIYDEVFARIYGRLYRVERRLGHTAEAERCLEKYSHFHALNSSVARRTGRPHGEMERLLDDKYDRGLQAAWKTQ